MATKMKCESGTESITVTEESEKNNQLEGTNQTGITTSSVSQKFKNCIPGRLTNQDICDLFEEHLDKNGEDKLRQECIKKIKEKQITGKMLVPICADEEKLNGLYEQLDFSYSCQKCFVQMMKFIRSRDEHFCGSTTQKNKETTTQEITDQADSKVHQRSSTTGIRLQGGKNVKLKTGNITTIGGGDDDVQSLDLNIHKDAETNLEFGEIKTEKSKK